MDHDVDESNDIDEEEDLNDFIEIAELDEGVGTDILSDDDTEEIEDEQYTSQPDISQFTLTKHEKPVFKCALSKNSISAATGGQDDTAYLWDLSTAQVVFECTGHKDSVTEIAFSHNDEMLATADLSGMVQVWSTQQLGKLLWSFEGDEVTWLEWHSLANVLVYGTRTGETYIWQVPQGNCKVVPAQGSPCFTGKLLLDGIHVLLGYENGVTKLVDMKSLKTVWQTPGNGKNEGITSISVNTEGTIACLAPTAEIVLLSEGKTLAILLSEGEQDIEQGLINSELGLFVSGSLSGRLCVWDYSKQVLRHQVVIADASITIMKWTIDGNVLIGSTDWNVYLFDPRLGNVIRSFTGHTGDILDISLASNGQFFLSGSEDKTAKIFALQ